MPICPECGEEVDDGYMFCPECGHDVDRSTGSAEEAQSTGSDRAAGAERDAWGATSADAAGTDAAGSTDDEGDTESAGQTEQGASERAATAEESTADPVDGPVTNADGESPFGEGPFSFAAGYATRDGWKSVLVGGLIELVGSLVPFVGLLVTGFGFRVAGAAARGQTDPPAFDEYGEMFVDGFRYVVLALVFLLAFGLGGAVLTVGGSAVHETVGTVVMVLVFAVAFYAFPASLTAYAAHRDVERALSPAYAGAFALTGTYLKAYLLFLVFGAVVFVAALLSLITIVGVLFVSAWGTYACSALWGYYYREAVACGEVPPAPADPV